MEYSLASNAMHYEETDGNCRQQHNIWATVSKTAVLVLAIITKCHWPEEKTMHLVSFYLHSSTTQTSVTGLM